MLKTDVSKFKMLIWGKIGMILDIILLLVEMEEFTRAEVNTEELTHQSSAMILIYYIYQ